MIREVYITETNCITPIGFDVAANIKNILGCVSGIQLQHNLQLMKTPFYASIVNNEEINKIIPILMDEIYTIGINK